MGVPEGVAAELVRCAVVFLPEEVPRQGRLAFWRPGGEEVPSGAGEVVEIGVAVAYGSGVRVQEVPAVLLPVSEALPVLTRARGAPHAHPAAACWGAAALHALQLAARGRLAPGLTPRALDAWHARPFPGAEGEQLRRTAAAMPAEGHAVPEPGSVPPRLPDPEELLRAFLDAVADTLPRTPAAPLAAGLPFAAAEPQRLPEARGWAREVAAVEESGVTLELRLDLGDAAVFDVGAAETAGAAVVQLRSRAEPALVADAAEVWAGERAEHFGPRARAAALAELRRAARVFAPLGRLLERSVPDVLALTEEEVQDLLGRAGRRLQRAGVHVHWPRRTAKELSARVVVRATAPGPAVEREPLLEQGDFLEFRWQLALDGEPLSESEMDALAEAHRPVVRLRDSWVPVDAELVRKARKRQLGLLEPSESLSVLLTGEVEVEGEPLPAVPEGALAELQRRLTEEPPPLPQPPALRATLRGYQLRGLAWLDRMTGLGLGGCLADDMGLGKTVTLIALHLHRAHPDPTLVVCPASLLANWQREIARFAPGESVHVFHGPGRSLPPGGPGLVLTTYATLRSSAPALSGQRWGLLVADEAQHVKNPRSATARALRSLRAPARIALTGTPVENNLSELWAILDWTTPGLLGPLKTFRARHARAVETGEDPEAAERLARLVRPFLLRRRKTEPGIAPELPPKTETDHAAPLSREQAALYQAVVRETLDEISASEGMARRGLVMKLLTSLKQICNHPAQYLRDAAPGTAARSGKLELLDELLGAILSEGGAVLLFTQYVAMGRLLLSHLEQRGVAARFLHGGTPVEERQRLVDEFQDGRVPVFLLSLKAAGTGLNLTRASHVVHYDRWWNPAVEEQATDRAHRIGQQGRVQVHRLITAGTVEERVTRLLEGKRQLAESVLGSGEAALTELDDADLADLVTLSGGPQRYEPGWPGVRTGGAGAPARGRGA
ncbi:DEAD/DEAH box helicase [Streptomyces sulphureus]|uniref:DEAD/DEAH box helicase n=1 Tax=Streptomyces sulphureus TaxID=47758 RepID=UPI00036E7E8C|nr:DEAD/DEAH box helicase [Streptomyces sulphureus]